MPSVTLSKVRYEKKKFKLEQEKNYQLIKDAGNDDKNVKMKDDLIFKYIRAITLNMKSF